MVEVLFGALAVILEFRSRPRSVFLEPSSVFFEPFPELAGLGEGEGFDPFFPDFGWDGGCCFPIFGEGVVC